MKRSFWLCGFLALILAPALGCASAYHQDLGCQVDCRYAPCPPLPYTEYDACACHACPVRRHLTASFAPSQDEPPAMEPLGEPSR